MPSESGELGAPLGGGDRAESLENLNNWSQHNRVAERRPGEKTILSTRVSHKSQAECLAASGKTSGGRRMTPPRSQEAIFGAYTGMMIVPVPTSYSGMLITPRTLGETSEGPCSMWVLIHWVLLRTQLTNLQSVYSNTKLWGAK